MVELERQTRKTVRSRRGILENATAGHTRILGVRPGGDRRSHRQTGHGHEPNQKDELVKTTADCADWGLPEALEILNLTYTIHPLCNSDQVEFYGLAKHRDQRIELDQNCPHDRQLITLWHEVYHVAETQLKPDPEKKEAFCDFVGLVIHNVLTHNPDLVEIYHKLHFCRETAQSADT